MYLFVILKQDSYKSDLASYNEQLSNNYFVFHRNEKPSHNNDLAFNNEEFPHNNFYFITTINIRNNDLLIS